MVLRVPYPKKHYTIQITAVEEDLCFLDRRWWGYWCSSPCRQRLVYYLLSTRLTYGGKLACIIFALQKGKKNTSYFPAGEDGEIGEMLMYLKRMYCPLESIFFPSKACLLRVSKIYVNLGKICLNILS